MGTAQESRSACERGFSSVIFFCAAHKMGMKSVWLSLRIQGYEQTCSGSSMMTLAVGILVCIAWLVPYPNAIGRKDCMLMLNNTVNSAWFTRERRL